MTIGREMAVVGSMYLFLSLTMLRALNKYKYRHHKSYQIKYPDIIFSVATLILSLTIIIASFLSIYYKNDDIFILTPDEEVILWVYLAGFTLASSIYLITRWRQIRLWGFWIDDPVAIKLLSRVGMIVMAVFVVNVLVLAYENAPTFPVQ